MSKAPLPLVICTPELREKPSWWQTSMEVDGTGVLPSTSRLEKSVVGEEVGTGSLLCARGAPPLERVREGEEKKQAADILGVVVKELRRDGLEVMMRRRVVSRRAGAETSMEGENVAIVPKPGLYVYGMQPFSREHRSNETIKLAPSAQT
ncbi:hypothetical protein QC761_0111690 [Podospora bellae-mahoneyi]|uniref:Uncharacterized protein n=1 Tax=Podospora bellae-mahoneyi TaxID=2093777 RepID=A0ABR0F6V8_9PEZI|nr:hypothetical protein QC761_0111690 [Podospora bellae-mahoneyi]